MKAYELRSQTKASLLAKLADAKQELASLRVAQVSNGAPSKLAKMYCLVYYVLHSIYSHTPWQHSKSVRQSVARILTVISQTQRDQLKVFYAGKKYQPLDLRVKKTRAIRRRLTAHERALKTTKQTKKNTHFPKRKYAVKA